MITPKSDLFDPTRQVQCQAFRINTLQFSPSACFRTAQ